MICSYFSTSIVIAGFSNGTGIASPLTITGLVPVLTLLAPTGTFSLRVSGIGLVIALDTGTGTGSGTGTDDGTGTGTSVTGTSSGCSEISYKGMRKS